jgi:hypothetical protein
MSKSNRIKTNIPDEHYRKITKLVDENEKAQDKCEGECKAKYPISQAIFDKETRDSRKKCLKQCSDEATTNLRREMQKIVTSIPLAEFHKKASKINPNFEEEWRSRTHAKEVEGVKKQIEKDASFSKKLAIKTIYANSQIAKSRAKSKAGGKSRKNRRKTQKKKC